MSDIKISQMQPWVGAVTGNIEIPAVFANENYRIAFSQMTPSTFGFGTMALQNANAVQITGGSVAVTALSGAITIENGGTGLAVAPGAGQLLIGTGTAYALSTLTAGSGISITNAAGAITISATGAGAGTVTSVDVSGGSTGLTFSGGPVTTSGTITMSGTLGVANGGTGASTAAAARANLSAAKSGANSDITSITGLTTPLSVSQGGTGANDSLSGYIFGNGTNPFTSVALIPMSDLTGILPINKGGTGGGNVTDARSNLLPAYIGNKNKALVVNTAENNVEWVLIPGTGTVTSVDVSGGTTGLTTSGGPVTTSGTITIAGTLNIANGGTGATTASGARTNLGLGTAAVLDAGVANGVATLDGGGTVPTSQLPAAVLGAVKYQGTWNASTNTPTLTSSVGTQGYYYVVSVAGTTNLNGITDWQIGDWAIYNGTVWEKIDNTDAVTSVNGKTGTVVLVASDVGAPTTTGTGATGTWAISVSGNAATVTNGVYTTGSYADPTWITSLAGSKITGSVASATTATTATSATTATTAGNLAGGAANRIAYQTGAGATDFVTAPTTANTFLEWSGSAFQWSSNPLGTVTSVGMTVPTGLTVSGSPITSSGTLAVSLQSGYSIPTTASQTNWDTAYNDRFKWDGGSTGLVAATGRTSLGATTVGSNLFTLTNPTAVTFLRVNVDNTVSTLDATSFRTAIGAGTGNGSVTSVDVSGGTTGLTTTGGAITGSGTITLSGTLVVANGGTGATTAAGARTNLGGTTVGSNLFTLTNPSAVTYLRLNADNTVSALDAATFRSAIGAGTVTSVSGSGGTTGLTLNGGPITGSGTLTLGGTLAIANGGTGATTAGGALTNLGGTTVGTNLFTLTNPGAVTFPRFNADNTVSALDASTFRTAIGAGTGNGSVTSVAFSAGTTGLSVTGSPITSSGTITLAGTLITSNGGTGLTSYTAGDLVYYASGTALSKLAIGAASRILTSSGSAPQWSDPAGITVGSATTATSATSATTATNLAGGASGSIPYQSAAGTTTFLASGTGVLAASGGAPAYTMSPSLTQVTVAGNPTTALQVATKQYVDGLVSSGITYHTPVKYEVPNTTGNLTATYNNGTAGVGATLTNAGTLAAFTPDGVVAQVGDRILVYNQTNAFENGVYTVTTVGSGSVAWVLTRATDANTYGLKSPNALGEGDAFFIQAGNTGAGETYVCNTSGTITFGTTAITFVQVSDSTLYTAGTGLTLTGTQFSLTSPVATTLGGTGLTSFTSGGAVYASSTSALTTGTLPVASGGTGQTSYTDGQLLIGNTATGSLSKATLTAGSGISITNGNGSITIASTLAGGTVTSVDVSGGTTGLTFSGGPVTTSGTITMAGTLAIANGGTGSTTAAGARTSLGATTVGANLFTLTNPGAITFPRFNADNTVSTLDAATFRTAIGAGTGNGTVTSVALSGGTTGLTVSGSPITSSGTITLAGTLAAANGGTGQSSYTIGDILYASTTTALSKLAGVATGNALISGGVGAAPSWGKIGLTTHVSGTLPIANGGTNATATPTAGAVAYGTGTAYAFTTAGTAGQVLVSNGASAPTFGSINGGTF